MATHGHSNGRSNGRSNRSKYLRPLHVCLALARVSACMHVTARFDGGLMPRDPGLHATVADMLRQLQPDMALYEGRLLSPNPLGWAGSEMVRVWVMVWMWMWR